LEEEVLQLQLPFQVLRCVLHHACRRIVGFGEKLAVLGIANKSQPPLLQFAAIHHPCLEKYEKQHPNVLVPQAHEDIMVHGIKELG